MSIDKTHMEMLKLAANELTKHAPKMIKTSKNKFTFNKIIITEDYGYNYGGLMSDGHLAILYTIPMKRGRFAGPGSNSYDNRQLRKQPPVPTNIALCSVLVSENENKLELEYIPTEASKDAVNELLSKIKDINNIPVNISESKLQKESIDNLKFTNISSLIKSLDQGNFNHNDIIIFSNPNSRIGLVTAKIRVTKTEKSVSYDLSIKDLDGDTLDSISFPPPGHETFKTDKKNRKFAYAKLTSWFKEGIDMKTSKTEARVRKTKEPVIDYKDEIVKPFKLKEGETYVWIMGAEPLLVKFNGQGKKEFTFNFSFLHHTGNHDLSMKDVRDYIKYPEGDVKKESKLKSLIKRIIKEEVKKMHENDSDEMSIDDLKQECIDELLRLLKNVNQWSVRDTVSKYTSFGFWTDSGEKQYASLDEATAKLVINKFIKHIHDSNIDSEIESLYDDMFKL